MKLNLPTSYIPFGPIGHPEARAFPLFMGTDKGEIIGELYSYLCKISAQNSVPSVFFDESKSLEDNGYHVLAIRNDEISDAELAALPRPRIFTPAASGEPGRKLQEMRTHIPGFYQHFDFEIWQPGQADCDHDFGLESYRSACKDKLTGAILSEEESCDDQREIAYYVAVTCTRCGAVHALEEQT